MQKWEYRSVQVSSDGKDYLSEERQWCSINELGAEGWELVSIWSVESASSRELHAIFKRTVYVYPPKKTTRTARMPFGGTIEVPEEPPPDLPVVPG